MVPLNFSTLCSHEHVETLIVRQRRKNHSNPLNLSQENSWHKTTIPFLLIEIDRCGRYTNSPSRLSKYVKWNVIISINILYENIATKPNFALKIMLVNIGQFQPHFLTLAPYFSYPWKSMFLLRMAKLRRRISKIFFW